MGGFFFLSLFPLLLRIGKQRRGLVPWVLRPCPVVVLLLLRFPPVGSSPSRGLTESFMPGKEARRWQGRGSCSRHPQSVENNTSKVHHAACVPPSCRGIFIFETTGKGDREEGWVILICTASKPILCGLLGHCYVSVESGSCSSDQLVDLHLPVTVISCTHWEEKKIGENVTRGGRDREGIFFFFRVHCPQESRVNPISK